MFKCSFYVRETFESKRNKMKRKKYIIKLLNNFIRFASASERARAQWHSGFAATSNRSESHIKNGKRSLCELSWNAYRTNRRLNALCVLCGRRIFSALQSIAIITMIFLSFFIQICFECTKKLWDRYGCLTFMMPHLCRAFDRCVFSYCEWRAFAPVRKSRVLYSCCTCIRQVRLGILDFQLLRPTSIMQ